MKKLESVYYNQPDSLDHYAAIVLPLAVKAQRIDYETKIHRLQGAKIFLNGNHNEALKIYLATIKKAEKYPPTIELAILYYETAGVYSKNNDVKTSSKYLTMGIALAKKLKSHVSIADGYNRIGVQHERASNLDSALYYYQQSLKYNILAKEDVGKSYSLENIGGIYGQQNKLPLALKYLKESLALRKKNDNKFGLAIININIAETYDRLNNYDSTKYYASQTLAIIKQIKFLDLEKHTYQLLGKLEEKNGNYKQAVANFYEYDRLKDSVYNDTKSKQLAEITTKYETEKKEQQIKNLNQQSLIQQLKLKQRNIYLLVAIALLIVGTSLAYLIYNRRKLAEQARLQFEINKQQEIAARAVLNAEERERRRIATDLHDGVGQLLSAALMNLNGLFKKAKFESSEEHLAERSLALVTESYDEMRSISHQMMPNALLKAGLASAVKEFLDKIDENQLKISLETIGLNERLDEQTETVLYRVIQETVNNVIKHAKATKLNIQLLKDEDGISATIEDNGKGFDSTKLKNMDGIGLKNILSRVGFLKGTVDFDSTPGKGTLVAIHIPVG